MRKPAALFTIAVLVAVIALAVVPLGPETGTVADVLWVTQMLLILIALVAGVRGVVLLRRNQSQ